MSQGLATVFGDPALVLSLLVGAFHTCVYLFLRGSLGWHLVAVAIGATLGALAGQALGARVGDVLRIGDYSLIWASALAWMGIGIALVSSAVLSRRSDPPPPPPGGQVRSRQD